MSDACLFATVSYRASMEDDGDEEFVAVEVELSRELLGEIDRMAVFHGYETPSAVVREALEQES